MRAKLGEKKIPLDRGDGVNSVRRGGGKNRETVTFTELVASATATPDWSRVQFIRAQQSDDS